MLFLLPPPSPNPIPSPPSSLSYRLPKREMESNMERGGDGGWRPSVTERQSAARGLTLESQ